MQGMDLEPGDVGLGRGRGFVAWAIRWAEARRYSSASQETRWNHAFMVVSRSGDLIEARARGVVRARQADEYADADDVILRPRRPTGGAGRAVADRVVSLGQRYGRLEILCLGLAFVFQTKHRFGVQGRHICSGAVSRAVTLGGLDMGDDEEWNSPADVMHVALEQDWQHVVGRPLVPGGTWRRRRGREPRVRA